MVGRRMFEFVTYTCNPIVGCYHDCIYCWARIQAKRQKHRCEECYTFTPHTHMERIYTLTNRPKKTPRDAVVFICSMSDLFGWWVDTSTILHILDFIGRNPQTTFFLETKNPRRMLGLEQYIPRNTIISTTIETTEYPSDAITKAPPIEERVSYFKAIKHQNKHVSIEPVIEFDLDKMLSWIKSIKPASVSIGYDNYGILKKHGIPEPSREKYTELCRALSEFTRVEDKSLRLEKFA